jgi:hypothetical protein
MNLRTAVVSLSLALAVGVSAVATSPAAARTYMSCDAHWKFVDLDEPFELDYASIDWRVRPEKCLHESDGTTAGQINLVGLSWRGWGTRRARAEGFTTANHYADDGSLPQYPVSVILSSRRKACPKPATKRFYYTRMRLLREDGSRSDSIPLFLPRPRCADSKKRRGAKQTEVFAYNVFLKNYTFGDSARTTILERSWQAHCRQVKRTPVPIARCRLSWDSDHAHWSATGRFRGAVRIGPPFKPFTWRFKVTEKCVGDACDYPGRDPDSLVRHHLWKGDGVNTPA